MVGDLARRTSGPIYQRFIQPEADDRHYARVSRIASVVVLFTGGIATWLMKDYSIDTIWNILLALGAGTGSVFMLRWFWWRINAWSEIVAMVASLVFFLLIGAEQQKLPTELIVVETPQLKILIVAALSIAAWLLATWITAPESNEKLTSFYRKIHPGGPGWKPIANVCPDVKADSNLGLSITAALVSSVLIYSVLPLCGYVIFRDYESAATCGVIALVSGLATVMLVRRLAGQRQF